MGKIETTLKEEISRLARKEIRASTDPLVKQVRELKRSVSGLQRTVDVLEREAGKRRKKKAKELQDLSAPEDEVKAARISPAWVQNLRMKLNVSQAELARLFADAGAQEGDLYGHWFEMEPRLEAGQPYSGATAPGLRSGARPARPAAGPARGRVRPPRP